MRFFIHSVPFQPRPGAPSPLERMILVRWRRFLYRPAPKSMVGHPGSWYARSQRPVPSESERKKFLRMVPLGLLGGDARLQEGGHRVALVPRYGSRRAQCESSQVSPVVCQWLAIVVQAIDRAQMGTGH